MNCIHFENKNEKTKSLEFTSVSTEINLNSSRLNPGSFFSRSSCNCFLLKDLHNELNASNIKNKISVLLANHRTTGS